MSSWNISTTAVELVPSVPRVFWIFSFGCAGVVAVSDILHVVIDDGRRYLERNVKKAIRRHHARSSAPGTGSRDEPAVLDRVLLRHPETAGTERHPATMRYPQGICGHPNFRRPRAAAIFSVPEGFPLARRPRLPFPREQSADRPTPALRNRRDRMPARAAQDLIEWGPESSAAHSSSPSFSAGSCRPDRDHFQSSLGRSLLAG